MEYTILFPQFGNLLITVIAFILCLSVIVFVHEFGHYYVGKLGGIHAEVFSIGFGPVLLSLNDKNMQGFSGGLTGDNIAVEYANVIYAFDESPVKKALFWAGTNDGLVHISQDGGETWKNIGLKNSGRISRIIVHPNDPDKVYVGALGHAYSPQKERGVYMTQDGGKSWKHVLYIDESTGSNDIVISNSNPNISPYFFITIPKRTWT